jgi:hypothetical protein
LRDKRATTRAIHRRATPAIRGAMKIFAGRYGAGTRLLRTPRAVNSGDGAAGHFRISF